MICWRSLNNHGNSFLIVFLFLSILVGAGYVVYNNKDFQHAHYKEIAKYNFYLRDYKKAAKDFSKRIDDKITNWKKSHPSTSKDENGPKAETRTFAELAYDQKILDQEIPGEMVRHQPDELTLCSFSADFLLNNPLTDKEMVHLANIFRFCDLSAIAGLQNPQFLAQITTLLKILRYPASFETSSPTGLSPTVMAYLYRNDKVKVLKPGQIYSQSDSLPAAPYYGAFKAGDFDFIVATFNTPSAGLALANIGPLENFYSAIQNTNQDIQDIMIFGDFTFRSEALSWDSASLLPTFAQSVNGDKAQSDLLGNFWFKKNDLVEFNGKSGLITIKEDLFSSQRKPPVSGNKPIWTQFRMLSNDD